MKTTGFIITLMLCVVLIGSTLAPVVSEAITTEETLVNDGLFNYGIFETSDSYVLSADIDNPDIITVNGEDMDNPLGTTAASYSLISSENFLVRMLYNSSAASPYQLTVVGLQSSNATIRMYMANLTATASEGTLTVSGTNTGGTEQTATFTYDEIYGIVPDGNDAVMKVPTAGAYIKGDSQLYASGLTTVSQWSDMIHFEGTYDDGITISSPNMSGATFDNIVWNIEPVSEYLDLYALTSIEFDVTYGDTTVHATYSYIAVPAEVTAELSQHLSSTEIALISVLPLIVIVAMVCAAAMMIRSKDY